MNKKKSRMIKGILAISLAGALALTGCQESLGLETDDLTISKYKEVEIEEVEGPEEVTDEDVAAYIDEKRVAEAVYEDVSDRAVQEGDTVNIDFAGSMDGEMREDLSEEGYDLVIGSDSFIEGFEDSVIGHKVGETFNWNGKFPDDYYVDDLAGKDVVFTITINGNTLEQVPEFDDAFVQSVSETSTTTEEYQEEVRQYLEERNEIMYRVEIAEEAWNVVMDNTEVKQYPEGAVQEQADYYKEMYEEMAEMYGIDMETFVTIYGYTSVEDFNAALETSAEYSVKQNMAVEAIADKENLSLNDQAYEEILEEIAVSSGGGTVEDLLEAADEEMLEETVRLYMVSDWVGDHCIQIADN